MPDLEIHKRDEQSAVAEFRWGALSSRAEVRVTVQGLLAVGGMVSAILLSTAAVVWVSTSVARERVAARRGG